LTAVETTRDNGAWIAGGPATVRGLQRPQPPYLGREGQFRGRHGSGANAVFADGTVQFLSAGLSPQAIEATATLHGRNDSAAGDW
jgi:prepilin-type processing-associated H-X9-DG protein